jgi:hypothetical protein
MKNTFNRIIFTAILVISFFTATHSQNESFRFNVNFGEFTNLTYQLDCLNNLTYCTTPDYQALWQKEFLQTEADKKMLESWRNIRNRYQKYFEIENEVKFPLDRRANAVNLSTKIQIAGLQAKNFDDYLSRLDLLVIPFEREEFAKVIKHFQPRFSAWWEKEAKPKGAGFETKTANLLANERIKSVISKVNNFYQPALPQGYLVTFNLFYRPQIVNAGSGGQAIENQLMVEFFADENPAGRLDVVLHEFCHFLLNSLAPKDHVELQNMFVKSGRATAFPAFGLLDESLASAFGNGMVARLFTRPEDWKKYLDYELSFYNNPNIDKAAKAILPILDDWLAKGGKLNDENFVKIYLDTLEKAFGEKLTSPKLYLGQAFMFIDEQFDRELRRPLRQTLNIASLYSEHGDLSKIALDDFVNNPNLSSIYLVSPKSIKSLVSRKIITDKHAKEIQKIYKSEKKVLYSLKRNPNAYVFIAVAENDESLKQIVQDLANAEKSFIGKFVK